MGRFLWIGSSFHLYILHPHDGVWSPNNLHIFIQCFMSITYMSLYQVSPDWNDIVLPIEVSNQKMLIWAHVKQLILYFSQHPWDAQGHPFLLRWRVSDNHSSMLSDRVKQFRSNRHSMIMFLPSSDIRRKTKVIQMSFFSLVNCPWQNWSSHEFTQCGNFKINVTILARDQTPWYVLCCCQDAVYGHIIFIAFVANGFDCRVG